jgi:hypothetical protein
MSGPRVRRLRRRDEAGYAAILVAMLAATILMPLAALSVDVARWYVEIERAQNAADAAAMAGVTYLPDNFAMAEQTAIAVAGRNGYPDSGSTSVSVTTGAKPTQLKVTVSSTINNGFADSFDLGFATISRSAVADYNGPAPLGSPCNAFGNEPASGAAGPSGSQIVAPTGGATCTSTPQLWGAIAGPATPKGNGDAHMTRTCASGNSGCSGTTNHEFQPMGYFYIVRVAPAAVNTDVTIQIYDPAFVETGDTCDKGPTNVTSPSGYGLKNAMNDYTTDGTSRYAMSPNGFCTGDVLTTDSAEAPVTSFALRAPTDTYRPANGAPVVGTDGRQCERQYKGYKRTVATSQTLRKYRNTSDSNASYNDELAKLTHQWVTMCTFRPQSAGDHYLQIRTNVKIPASAVADGNGGYRNNPNVYTQTTDDTSVQGNGNNRFALRILGSQRGAVSVSGWDTMSIYANYTGASSTFNLVRVIPAAASKNLLIDFYDVGDASDAGTITVLPPLDSNMVTPITGCTGGGVKSGALSGCKLTGVSSGSGWNGKAQTIKVPIPNTYTCNSTQPGGCWFRLQVSFPGGVSDTTTWGARVEGDPIRLIE